MQVLCNCSYNPNFSLSVITLCTVNLMQLTYLLSTVFKLCWPIFVCCAGQVSGQCVRYLTIIMSTAIHHRGETGCKYCETAVRGINFATHVFRSINV